MYLPKKNNESDLHLKMEKYPHVINKIKILNYKTSPLLIALLFIFISIE